MAAAVRLLLVFATLHAQSPCGLGAGVASPAADPVSPPVTPAELGCGCCKRSREPDQELPAPSNRDSAPAEPDRPANCPCPLCSPGFVPLCEPVRATAPADVPDGFPHPATTSHARPGHRPSLDRPPRPAV